MSYQAAVNLGLTTAIVTGSNPPRGYTDAEIVTILHTLTVHDIPVDSVRTWFREKELWLERSTGEMFGPLQVAYENAPQEAKDGLDYLYDAVFAKSATYLRTTEPVWAQKAFSLVQLILQLSPSSSGLVDSFYALDGGRPHKDLTVEQFAAQRTTAETEAAAFATKTALTTAFHAYLNAIGTSEQGDRKTDLWTALEAN
jgi:hypothetical protein